MAAAVPWQAMAGAGASHMNAWAQMEFLRKNRPSKTELRPFQYDPGFQQSLALLGGTAKDWLSPGYSAISEDKQALMRQQARFDVGQGLEGLERKTKQQGAQTFGPDAGQGSGQMADILERQGREGLRAQATSSTRVSLEADAATRQARLAALSALSNVAGLHAQMTGMRQAHAANQYSAERAWKDELAAYRLARETGISEAYLGAAPLRTFGKSGGGDVYNFSNYGGGGGGGQPAQASGTGGGGPRMSLDQRYRQARIT